MRLITSQMFRNLAGGKVVLDERGRHLVHQCVTWCGLHNPEDKYAGWTPSHVLRLAANEFKGSFKDLTPNQRVGIASLRDDL